LPGFIFKVKRNQFCKVMIVFNDKDSFSQGRTPRLIIYMEEQFSTFILSCFVVRSLFDWNAKLRMAGIP